MPTTKFLKPANNFSLYIQTNGIKKRVIKMEVLILVPSQKDQPRNANGVNSASSANEIVIGKLLPIGSFHGP